MTKTEYRNKMLLRHMGLVKRWVNRYINRNKSGGVQDADDYFQEAAIGFILAVKRYDRSRSGASTFFYKRIMGSIVDSKRKLFVLRSSKDRNNQPEQVDLEAVDQSLSYEINFDGNREIINKGMNCLTEKQRRVINAVFLQGRPQVEVAKELGVVASDISILKKTALNNMREYFEKNNITKECVL